MTSAGQNDVVGRLGDGPPRPLAGRVGVRTAVLASLLLSACSSDPTEVLEPGPATDGGMYRNDVLMATDGGMTRTEPSCGATSAVLFAFGEAEAALNDRATVRADGNTYRLEVGADLDLSVSSFLLSIGAFDVNGVLWALSVRFEPKRSFG